MKALVTGANGFLGRHVIAALAERGHSVRAIVRPATDLSRPRWSDQVEVFRGDLRTAKDLEAAFENVDVLIHLAATVVGDQDAQLAETVVGTTRLLQAMTKSNTRKVVLASSFSVYDWEAARGTLTEKTPLAANLYERDGYAIAKFWQERVARRMVDEVAGQLTVLRPGFIWGKGNEYLACLGQSAGPLHFVIGPMSHLPLTYVENCADAFVTAAEQPVANGQTFNVVDDDVVNAWTYTGQYLRGSNTRGVRIPLPYHLFLIMTHLAQWTSRRLFNGKGKLPSLFVPCRFKARFKPLRYTNAKLQTVLNWEPAKSFAEAATLTWNASNRIAPEAGTLSTTEANPEAVGTAA